jgi:ribosomal protein S11
MAATLPGSVKNKPSLILSINTRYPRKRGSKSSIEKQLLEELMAKKIKYTATLSDGTILTRSSERPYTHAWAIIWDGKELGCTGFSGSRELAEKAAQACMPTDHEAAFKKKRRGSSPFSAAYAVKSTLKWLKEYHEGSWAKYQESRQAMLARMRIEIVPCIPV